LVDPVFCFAEENMTTDYRIEKDSLGEVRVPAGAYWGAQTQRAIHNFPITGLRPYPAFVWSMAMIKRAAAEVNRDLALFNDKEAGGRTITGADMAGAIMTAADEVIAGQWADQFVVDPIQAGAGTSHNMNLNEVIANRANELLGFGLDAKGKPVSPNDHVNMAQSTNDTIPTAIRLGALWRLDELLATLARLAAGLRAKSAEFDGIIKSGRTHLQDAVPVRLGQEFGAYARAIERDTEKIREAAEGLRRLGIGGTATGTGLNAHPEYHARMVDVLGRLTGLTLLRERQPVRVDAEHGRRRPLQRRAAHAGRRPDAHRQRLPVAGLRPDDRPGRDSPAAGAARLVDHARQGQPGAGRDAEHGHVPGAGQRPDGHAGRAGRANWN
jgi:fumarate hydratase class II